MSQTSFFIPVQQNIKLVEDLMRVQAGAEHHTDLRAALEHLLSAGGKRVRPAVVFLVGNMLSGPQEKLVTLAASIEMLHTATLVHDDLIDGSLLRRGMPTLNTRWSPAATVLTGDFLFARAAKLAAETENIRLIKLFAETLSVIINGELTQMFESKGLINRDNYYQRIYAKTASLFELSAHASAILSTEDKNTQAALKAFGYEIGMAFQIVDDILDFTGEQTAIGKPVGSDLLNGLVTLPAIYYAETHPEDENVRFLKEGGWANPERMEELVSAIRESQSIHRALDEARERVSKSLKVLDKFPASPERKALEEMASYIVDRNI